MIGKEKVKDICGGRRVTMVEVKPHGRNGNLKWKVLSNEESPNGHINIKKCAGRGKGVHHHNK